MTLREKSFEIPQRRYSVSNSGRYKSCNKLRPSLSGDLFRPDPEQLKQLENVFKTDTTSSTRRPSEAPNRSGPTEPVTPGSTGNPQQQPQQQMFCPPSAPPPLHLSHDSSNRQTTKVVFETSL